MSNRTLQLDDRLYQYLLDNSLREDPVLSELRAHTAHLPGSNMQIAPEQGQFMAMLVKCLGARHCLDIGCFTGYSALVVAMALPSDGEVISFDIDERATKVAQEYWQRAGVANKIQLRLGNARDKLDEFISERGPGSVDFVFIDADKASYPVFYEQALTLLKSGGVVVVDNVLWGGAVANPSDDDKRTQIIRDLNATIHHDERVDSSLLPVADGLYIARKR